VNDVSGQVGQSVNEGVRGNERGPSTVLPDGTATGRSLVPHRHMRTLAAGVTVPVTGVIDMATAGALHDALTSHIRAAAPGTHVIADFSGVTFVDARGLTTLVGAAKTARARKAVFRLTGCPPCLLRLLEITDTRSLLSLT
jgi:anti-sigma B factor antagonist